MIVTVVVTPAEVQDNQPAVDLLWRTRFRGKLRPRRVTADTTYGTVENIVAIEDQALRADVPLSEAGRRPGLFADTDVVDDSEADVDRCPGEATLRLISQCERTKRRVYEAPASHCLACALKANCTTSHRGRRVGRGLDEDDLDRVRGYHATEPFAKAMRKRKVWIEPLVAEAKEWHGLRRFRLRGLEKVNGEALLIAVGENLKRLLSRWGWGRRPWPNGAAGVVLPTANPLVVSPGRCPFPVSRRCSVPQPPHPFFNRLDRFCLTARARRSPPSTARGREWRRRIDGR